MQFSQEQSAAIQALDRAFASAAEQSSSATGATMAEQEVAGQAAKEGMGEGIKAGPEAALRAVMPEAPFGQPTQKNVYSKPLACATGDRASSQPVVQLPSIADQGQGQGKAGGTPVPQDQDPFLLLARDHEIMRRLLAEYAAAVELGKRPGSYESSVQSRAAIIPQLVAAIVSHASVEEQHVHGLYRERLADIGVVDHGPPGMHSGAVPAAGVPAISSHAGPGATLGDAFYSDSLAVDQANKDALYILEHADLSTRQGVQAADDAFDLVDAIEADHLRVEDEVYFPALRARMTSAELVQLQSALVSSKAWAPTHAHPAAPDKPLLARLTHPLAGLLDRARDVLLGTGTHAAGVGAGQLASAGPGVGQAPPASAGGGVAGKPSGQRLEQAGQPAQSSFKPVRLPEGR